MRPYLATTLAYLLFSVLWILLSDHAVAVLVSDPAEMLRVQSAKGIVFVLLSAGLIFHVSRRLHDRELEREAEKARLYRDTMGAVHHIVRNYLNQMQLVTLHAEETPDFDAETLALAHRATQRTEDELAGLSSIDDLSPDELRRFVASTLGEPSRV